MNNDIEKLISDIDNDKIPWYKELWDNIVFYIYYKPKYLYYDIKFYIKNRILFNKILISWRPWDYSHQIELFAFGLEQLKLAMENGNEIRETANKKIKACDELIRQLRRKVEDEVIFDKEKETYKEYETRYTNAHMNKFDEINRLMRGQNPNDYKEGENGYQDYIDWFDGTGIEKWWD